jgi:hypothetical protein
MQLAIAHEGERVVAVPAPDILQARDGRRELWHQLWQEADLLLLPLSGILAHGEAKDQLVIDLQHEAIPSACDGMCPLYAHLREVALDQRRVLRNGEYGIGHALTPNAQTQALGLIDLNSSLVW